MRRAAARVAAVVLLAGAGACGIARGDSLRITLAGGPYYRPFSYLSLRLHVPDPPPRWIEISARGAMTLRIEAPGAGEISAPLLVGDGAPEDLVARADGGGTAGIEGGAVDWRLAGPATEPGAEEAGAGEIGPWADGGRVEEAIGGWTPGLPREMRRDVAVAGVVAALVLAAVAMAGRRWRAAGTTAVVIGLLVVMRGVLGAAPAAIVYSFRVAPGYPKNDVEDTWLIAVGRRAEVVELPSGTLPHPMGSSLGLDESDRPVLVWRAGAMDGEARWVLRKRLTAGERWACAWRGRADVGQWQAIGDEADGGAVALARALYPSEFSRAGGAEVRREVGADGQAENVVVLPAK